MIAGSLLLDGESIDSDIKPGECRVGNWAGSPRDRSMRYWLTVDMKARSCGVLSESEGMSCMLWGLSVGVTGGLMDRAKD